MMQCLELSRLRTLPAKHIDHRQRFTIENDNLRIAQVRDIKKLLLPVGREREAGGCLTPGSNLCLGYEFPRRAENLDPLIASIRHINESVVGNFDCMNEAELLGRSGRFG